MINGKMNILLDAFWGSSGKGKVSTFLADKYNVAHVSSSNFPNAGHCVVGSTYVWDKNGISRIEEIVRSKADNAKTINRFGQWEEISHFHNDGKRLVNRVKVRNGVQLECTDEHKFLVWDRTSLSMEWVRSMDLNIEKHFFLFPKNIPSIDGGLIPPNWSCSSAPNKTEVHPPGDLEFAEYLGLLVGDGYYAKKTRVDIAFHTSQMDVMERVQSMYTKMGITNQHVSRVGDKECYVLSTSQCSGLNELFVKVGLLLAVKDEKRTPYRVMHSRSEIMSAYLRGLFDADGCAKKDRVTFSNCSKSVVQDAQQLLFALGVNSRLSSHYDKRHRSNRKTKYSLDICGISNLLQFQQAVGFLSRRKSELLARVISDIGQSIPINEDAVLNFQNIGPFASPCMNAFTVLEAAKSGAVDTNSDLYRVAKDYHIESIDSIDREYREAEVFDITVPGTHSYLANGCVSHNSSVFADGTKFVAKAIPTAAVLRKVTGSGIKCYISPGSGYAWNQLFKEWMECDRPEMYIHSRASIVTEDHARREREGSESTKHIASTMQGSGTAIVDKVLRKADCVLSGSQDLSSLVGHMFEHDEKIRSILNHDHRNVSLFLERVHVVEPQEFRNITHSVLRNANPWLHEGSQGYALSIDHGSHYPNCTSRNCSVQAAMDHMAVPPSLVGDVYLNLRTYPIRVGNVVEDGVQRGFSGGFYPDCRELTWEEIGQGAGMPPEETKRLLQTELTTVTKRLRRPCTFSFEGLKDAVQTNGATKLALNFVQYVDWKDHKLKGGRESFQKLSRKSRELIEQIENTANVPVVLIGTGALHDEMIDLL